ncbi:uncharacterized protein LOC143179630 [Calliopsis andreniformis]|uniref:uncharacterized protein LOC143179630 n=1 Tax=Calliopsis andreniformis TaxID=337506 RepID=UPI003FCC7F87
MKRKDRKNPNKQANIRSKQLEARGVSIDMKTSWAAQDLTSAFSNLNVARFQQKQLQEKEQKLLQLYDQQQQRAYQVVQRGSASSNGSSHGSTISQHSVTKTSTSSHTASTSQGGKVRQMFDERRQTTVKGIDRSYPLEPLENKPRKQTNGNAAQRNGNLTVSRQSVTVKRVARADANSNLNGGKPVVSYHEEITRESFGPSERQHTNDDFENENYVAQYANGNHQDKVPIEDFLEEDTMQRNRMMAKLHLMEYDETLKHRVKNDLESEEFPEDFMVDVPDKLPKQSVTRKLSQAEVRLERFKNANAKRNNNMAKNTNTISVTKKRSDTVFPTKSTSSVNEVTKNRTQKIVEKGSLGRKESPRNDESDVTAVGYKNLEESLSASDSEGNERRRSKSPRSFCIETKDFATTFRIDSKTSRRLSPDVSKNVRKRSESPKFFCKESEKSATTYAIDSKTAGRLSPDVSKNVRKRSESPKFFCKESEKSATTYAIDSKTAGRLSPDISKNIKKRSESPKFFCKESEKSATTYAIDSKTAGRLSPDVSKNIKKRSESPKFFCKESEKSATTYAIDSKTAGRLSPDVSKNVRKRSESPKFFCKESEKSATTYAIDSKTAGRLSPDVSKNVRKRSESPKFFCKESEKSATTYAIDSKTAGRLSPDVSKNVRKRSESPKFFCKESEKSATTYAIDSKTAGRLSPDVSKNIKKRSESPKFFCKESEKSATTYAIDSKTAQELSPKFSKSMKHVQLASKTHKNIPVIHGKDVKEKSNKQTIIVGFDTMDRDTKSPQSETSNRTSSPETVKRIKGKDESTIRNKSPSFFERIKERAMSPQFFNRKSKKTSATKLTSKSPELSEKIPRKDSKKISPKNQEHSLAYISKTRTSDSIKKDLRNTNRSPQLLSTNPDRSSTIIFVTPETIRKPRTESGKYRKKQQTPEPVTNRIAQSSRKISEEDINANSRYNIRNSVSRFFSEQCEKAAKNANVKTLEAGGNSDLSRSSSPVSLKDMNESRPTNKVPLPYRNDTENSTTTIDGSKSSRESSPKSQKLNKKFFWYGSDKSSQKPKSTKQLTDERSKSPRSKLSSLINIGTKSSKSPNDINSIKRTKVIINYNEDNSRDSSPKPLKTINGKSGASKFFRHELDKPNTLVDLKPKFKEGSSVKQPNSLLSGSNYSTSIHFRDKNSKSPDNSSGRTSSRSSSPKSEKIVDNRSRTPEFFCYETERSATTVSLKPKSSDSTGPWQRSSNFPAVQSPTRSLKSPDSLVAPKDTKTTRRGSSNVLRSTKLIRSIISHPSNKPQTNCLSKKNLKEEQNTSTISKDAREAPDEGNRELKYRPRKTESKELTTNITMSKITMTAFSKPYELPSPKSSSRSSTSAEVDVEIQEITLPDQYIKQKRLEREQLGSTYTKSSPGSKKTPKTETSFTYSARRASKKRSSLFESDIFEAPRKDQQTTDDPGISKSSRTASSREEKDNSLKQMIQNASTERSCPARESVIHASKRGVKSKVANEEEVSNILRQSPSQLKEAKVSLQETLLSESKLCKPKKQAQTLRSIDLIKKIINKEPQSEKEGTYQETFRETEISEKYGTSSSLEDEINKNVSVSTMIETTNLENKSGSWGKNYERTDSVESALRRFDSIGTETSVASGQSTLERNKGSITEKRQTLLETSRIGSLTDDSETISLKALDQNVNFPRGPGDEPSTSTLRKTSAVTVPGLVKSRKMETSKTQETRHQKRLAKARDSIELARISARSGSPACKRKLFSDTDSVEVETESSSSKHSLDSIKTVERLSSRKTEPVKTEIGSPKTVSKFLKSVPSGASTKRSDTRKANGPSTGDIGSDCSVSVKQLRSIEDIRKSIESESPNRKAREVSPKSAIASSALRGLSTVHPQSRRTSGEDRGESKRETLLKRPENLSVKNNALGDSVRVVSCMPRFSRVVKSPSPDLMKAPETGNRPRRNVPPSPSKSPDTASRRSSTDAKIQDTKLLKRPVPAKSTEPIGNRKSTTTRKSTDVVDGAVLENGLHLRDQTIETKYDNDSSATKKGEAFIIDFDEQPSKENDGPPLRKPLLRKRSTDKQTLPTQSGRPPSSVSSTSSGSSMQASVTKGKMASRARTPISGTTTSKGSASSKGGSSCAVEQLVPCKVCGRRFAQDRVGLHEQICTKTGQKKRKQFDTMMHRVRGTELESFVKKGICKKIEKPKKTEVKSNWRRKHEDFINAIRSAKQVQAHLAAGGKISDLPPPPPSDTSDYIQCPHCGRKFNQAAAERHIPKCEHMLHNKPVHVRAPKPRR